MEEELRQPAEPSVRGALLLALRLRYAVRAALCRAMPHRAMPRCAALRAAIHCRSLRCHLCWTSALAQLAAEPPARRIGRCG